MAEVTEERMTIPKFNDNPTDSFHLWKLRMEAIMESRDFYDVVFGIEKRHRSPTDEGDSGQIEAINILQAAY
jgi:hypothetical protein